LREQLLDQGVIPMGEHDWRVDVVITPDEILVRDHSQEENIVL
jgi:5-formyltetrahydrofolate cyclo-ligase